MQSLQSRVRAAAAQTGKNAQQIRRELLHRRILARVFDPAGDPERWVLRGGTSILMRIPTARPTRDVDLRYSSDSQEEALAALRGALARSAVDPFSFRIARTLPMMGEVHPGFRVTVEAYIGTSLLEKVSLDIIYDTMTPLAAEPVVAVEVVVMDEIGPPPTILLYPVPDQIADKVCAMYATYGRAAAPSTRYHDLVDLVLLVESCDVPAEVTVQRVTDEATRRGLVLPVNLVSPGGDWPRGYARSAATASLRQELRDLDVALAVAGVVLNPILAAAATGR